MALFLFTGMRASQMLLQELNTHHQPRFWRGTYREVLPYLQHAFAKNLLAIRDSFADKVLGVEITEVIQQMCDPDISSRGDKSHKSKYGSRFELQRFVSRFDRLRAAAIIGKLKHP
jgi:hypothetical protein